MLSIPARWVKLCASFPILEWASTPCRSWVCWKEKPLIRFSPPSEGTPHNSTVYNLCILMPEWLLNNHPSSLNLAEIKILQMLFYVIVFIRYLLFCSIFIIELLCPVLHVWLFLFVADELCCSFVWLKQKQNPWNIKADWSSFESLFDHLVLKSNPALKARSLNFV